MLNQQTVQQLHALKLFGFAEAFEDQCRNPAFQDEPFERRIAYMIDRETNFQENKRLTRRKRQARLSLPEAVSEDIDYTTPRGLDKALMLTLLLCNWIGHGQDLIIIGPTGIGKSWVANAIANEVMRKSYPVVFWRFSRLMEEYDKARGDGTLPRLRARLVKPDLLVIDDWLGTRPSLENVLELRELVEDRHRRGSILLTSQLPESDWYDRFGDPTHADSILDRVLSQPHRIVMRGESLRKRHANLKGGAA